MTTNKRILREFLPLAAVLCLASLAGCSGDDGKSCTVNEDATSGDVTISCGDGTSVVVSDGAAGGCTVTSDGAGTSTLTCDDGTSATINDGTGGGGCTVADMGGGVKTITCDDGTSVTINDGTSGTVLPGRGLVIDVATAAPANGTHFVAGEAIVITMTVTDSADNPLMLDDLSSAALYMAGPRDVLLNRSANALLNASTDRAAADRQHHYINLKTTTNDNLAVADNVLTYTLEAITSEDPGTYTIGVRGVSAASEADRVFTLHEVQIGTATAEAMIVGNCVDCHLGADSGKIYMHHIDPGHSAFGSPEIDSDPVRTCYMCHNNDGYAAFSACDDGSRPPCTGTTVPTPDAIIRRVHGIHMGEGLSSEFNIAEGGDFHDYEGVVFPADVRNCSKCHTDDSWNDSPSRMACGACHDNLNFTTGLLVPPSLAGTCTVTADCDSGWTCNADDRCERSDHGGGIQMNDAACAGCHGSAAIESYHAIETGEPEYDVTMTLSDPANGTHFVAGETPTLTIAITDATTGDPLNPNTMAEASFYRAQMFLSGPREDTGPALTAALSGTSYAYNDLRVRTAMADEDPNLTRSATAITYQLDDVAGLRPGTYTTMLRLRSARSAPAYSWTSTTFQVGTATEEEMIAGNCRTCHEDTTMHGYAFFEPDLCKNCHNYTREDMVEVGWADGYGFGPPPLARMVHGIHFNAYLDKPEESAVGDAGIIFPQDVRNCTTCHNSPAMNWTEDPSRLACLACHDSDAAIAHAARQTTDPTPDDVFSGDEIETCEVCHGGGADFSPANVHNISNPYRPPYAR